MTLRWNLEEINLREQAVFVRGWLWQQGATVRTIQLVLRDQKGKERSRIRLLHGQPRTDVASCFPREDGESLNTGFVGLGAWDCRPVATDQLELEVCFHNTENLCLDVGNKANLKEAKHLHWLQKIQQLWGLLQQATNLISRGDWRGFFYRLSLHAEQQTSRALPEEKAWLNLVNTLPPGRPIHLIVDHQLGGGANGYRERQVENWLAEGAIAIILSFQISKLAYDLRLLWDDNCRRFSSDSEIAVLDALILIRPSKIVFNNAVSFAAPMRITPLLLLLKQRCRAELVVLIHDYFLVCPTIYLMNGEDQFCGVPHLKHCDKCLPSCQHLFSSFYRGSVGHWRANWGSLLAQADRIIAFSEASALLLRRAYKQWPNWVTIEIKPHTLPSPPGAPIHLPRPTKMIIGVVGQIGVQKGCKIIQQLAQHIQAEGGDERIAVIGSMECPVNPRIVSQTGHYQRQDLRRLIVESGANIMLMPSVWPETFSYVTEELIQLGLPIACFDLGAPAERVKHYAKGKLLSSMDPASIQRELREFFQATHGIPNAKYHDN